MLRLTDITKDYKVADTVVHALRGVSLSFRKNEFVSILGPSGCGKTTLLNIIGGLDKYTSGDLAIAGVSTKAFKDADWDVYRNHRVGFIFQSYNLIPHQTVLGNVELALTIAGMSKAERVEKAKKALDRVGLEGQYYKRPNQLSGGQCQRVAIARALVNEPEILLADEPTGALDTVTSVQIMDLIKEIANERLVIMVTHNPELAEKYSTRIIRLLDGQVTEDTAPFSAEDEVAEVTAIKEIADREEQQYLAEVEARGGNVKKAKKKRKERAKMSVFTAFMLSARNLISKRARTIMVGIAGSIGITGIALVLAFSSGIKGYVASMQDDMLSGNPITITEQTYDLNALTGMMETSDKVEIIKEPNRVYIDELVGYIAKTSEQVDSMIIKNDINANYIEFIKGMPKEYYASMSFGYGIDMSNNIYTGFKKNADDDGQNISISALTNTYSSVLKQTDFGEYSSFVTSIVPSFEQAPSSKDYIEGQYEVYGKVATEKNEIMLVISDDDMLTDVLLARLGYYTQAEFLNIVYNAIEDESTPEGDRYYDASLDKESFSYEELLAKKFIWYANDDIYEKNTNPMLAAMQPYHYKHVDDDINKANGLELSVVGILKPKENISYGCLSSGIYYTGALTEYVLEQNANSEIVKFANDYIEQSQSTDNPREAVVSGVFGEMPMGITYEYEYAYKNKTFTATGFVGESAGMAAMLVGDIYSLTPRHLGGVSVANSVTIHPLDFDQKDMVTAYLDQWNGDSDITVGESVIKAADRQDIKYTDTLSLVIDLINNMIDIVSYALIAFTSVSLVVSTVMIGIITYVSVVERIKEIGVIRSLGGRKKDVSRLFTAETVIIGLLAGLIGVLFTYGVSEIVNLILYPLIGIRRIAALPVTDALLLTGLSVVLTLISGVFPARAAAKKDPVVALRTE